MMNDEDIDQNVENLKFGAPRGSHFDFRYMSNRHKMIFR